MKTLQQISKLSPDPKRANQIGEFVFRELRKELTSMQHQSVYVPHLGTFAVSEVKIRKTIIGLIHTIRKYEEKQSTEYVAILRESLRKQLILKNKLAIQSYEQRINQRKKYSQSDPVQNQI